MVACRTASCAGRSVASSGIRVIVASTPFVGSASMSRMARWVAVTNARRASFLGPSSAAALDGPKKDALRAFVTATQRAMRDIEADPTKGVDATITRIPELATDRPAQLAVLQATIALWESDYTRTNGMGAVDPALWERSISFMAVS